MQVDFSKHELKRLREALVTAMNEEECFIQAHRTKLMRKGNQIIDVIPKEFKPVVEKTQRNIKAYRKLLRKVNGFL